MYATTTHYDNNNTTWLNRQCFYAQPQQFQFTHISAVDPATRLKHKEVELYKTEACRNWTELGHCRYGKKCRYAHGASELRTVHRHNRYKTQICRAYHMDGSCPYGIRCTFVHDSDILPGQEVGRSGDNHIASAQPLQTGPSLNRVAMYRSELMYTRRRSSFVSHDDASSTSGSSSGDESLASTSLVDSNNRHYYYHYRDTKEAIMKQQGPIETTYDILYCNNFNNNNTTTVWM